MNRERLLKLADYMAGVDPRNYYQGLWLGRLNENDYDIVNPDWERRIVIHDGVCGTTMCVLGHAVAAIPEAGLWFKCVRHGVTHVMHLDPETRIVSSNLAAAREVFGIPESHAQVLFGTEESPRTYMFYTGHRLRVRRRDFHELVTPTTVAMKLREYVETDGLSADAVLKAFSY